MHPTEQDRGEQEEEGGGHYNFLWKSRGGGVVTYAGLSPTTRIKERVNDIVYTKSVGSRLQDRRV